MDEDTAMYLAGLEHRWAATRDLGAVAEAIKHHTQHGLPIPEWCVDPAVAGIALLQQKGGRGKRTPARDTANAKRDLMLCSMVILARLDPVTDVPGLMSVEEGIRQVAKSRGASESTVRDAFYANRHHYPYEQVQ